MTYALDCDSCGAVVYRMTRKPDRDDVLRDTWVYRETPGDATNGDPIMCHKCQTRISPSEFLSRSYQVEEV